jgi:hypothetical protein
MGSMMRGHETLSTQLEAYLKGIEADEEDGESSDLTGKWRKADKDLMDDNLEQVRGYWRDVANEEEDALDPLRRVMGRIASLNEAVNVAKSAPEEGELRDLGPEAGVGKKGADAAG